MTSFKDLTSPQLKKMLANTEAEIKRREQIQLATTEILALLKKYKITMQDIDLQALNRKAVGQVAKTRKPQPGARDNRKRVKAKYKNPTGSETWSGRGRAPSWVLLICQKHGIELATFKKDSRFLQA